MVNYVLHLHMQMLAFLQVGPLVCLGGLVHHRFHIELMLVSFSVLHAHVRCVVQSIHMYLTLKQSDESQQDATDVSPLRVHVLR